jgi:S1-C subfamily serine protease
MYLTLAPALILSQILLQFPSPQPFTQPYPQQPYSLGTFGMFTPLGLLVQTVTPGSPAANAGIAPRDLIVSINNFQVTNQDQFQNALQNSNGKLAISVKRAATGQLALVNIDLGGNFGSLQAPYLLGITGQFTPQGMLVQTVFDATPANQAGIRQGDLVQRINNQFIGNQNQYFQVLAESGGKAVIDIRRGGQAAQFNVDLLLARFGTLGLYTNKGIQFVQVTPDTPASRAGIQPGDTGLTVNNQFVRNQNDFETLLDQSRGVIFVNVQKGQFGGQATMVRVELMNNSLGAWCEPGAGGMQVFTAPAGTTANRIGLSPGDTITRVNGLATPNLPALQNALETARGEIVLSVRFGANGRFGFLRVNIR